MTIWYLGSCCYNLFDGIKAAFSLGLVILHPCGKTILYTLSNSPWVCEFSILDKLNSYSSCPYLALCECWALLTLNLSSFFPQAQYSTEYTKVPSVDLHCIHLSLFLLLSSPPLSLSPLPASALSSMGLISGNSSQLGLLDSQLLLPNSGASLMTVWVACSTFWKLRQ